MAKNNKGEEKGVILFVSSVAAEEAKTGTAAYGATKGALNAMMLPMARDLGRYHIRVAAIAPGIFDTPIGESMSQTYVNSLIKNTPMGRPGHPSEFAQFCQSVIENSYINGVRLRIDGAIKLSHL